MGRHADPDPRHFYRSVAVSLGRGLLALVLVSLLVAVLSLLGRPGGPGPIIVLDHGAGPAIEVPAEVTAAPPPPSTASPSPRPSPRPATSPTPAPSPEATPSPSPSPSPAVPAEGADPFGAPAPSATTVQVLDGVGDRVRAQAAREVLTGLGYRVVALNPAGVDYDATTVLFTAGNEAAAEALRAADRRFGAVAANRNLSEQVMLHVVVGRDWSR
jgi:hypothetical protein